MSLFFVKRHVACFLINGDDNLLVVVVVVGLHLEFQYVPFFVIPTTNARTFFLFLHDMHDIHLWISKSYIGLPIFNTFTSFYTIIHLIPTNDCIFACFISLMNIEKNFLPNGKTNSDCGLRFCISIPQSYRKFGGAKVTLEWTTTQYYSDEGCMISSGFPNLWLTYGKRLGYL